jgi:hypothetical protein
LGINLEKVSITLEMAKPVLRALGTSIPLTGGQAVNWWVAKYCPSSGVLTSKDIDVIVEPLRQAAENLKATAGQDAGKFDKFLKLRLSQIETIVQKLTGQRRG